jgi:SagB-type dehydrogenase family enzyme
MRKVSFILTVLLFITAMHAQDLKKIQLNNPDKNRGSSVMKALSDRRSDRAYADKALSLQDLSDLLWAANGINRPDGKRTAPSALNKQDIDIYVIMKEGAYLYDAKSNSLQPIAKGDHRGAVAGGQDFVKTAPVSLVLVSDLSRFGKITDHVKLMAAVDAGCVSQNINIFCSAVGLATVPRASMDMNALKQILKLTENQLPLINNPVGYFKK